MTQEEYDNLHYVIFDYSEIDLIDFNEVRETSKETVRLSVDGLLTFVKWLGDIVPVCVENLPVKSQYYNHSEMLSILDEPEWSDYSPISGTTF
jgi:hypothetical protein